MRFNRNLLSWMSATYGLIIYSIAFAIEMWFIVGYNQLINNSVPVMAFVLSAIYFIVVIISLILILALIIHSIILIMCWILIMSLLFLPECGIVLFITIYKWGIDSRNGQIELFFYIARGVLNVTFLVCVQSLLNQWKSEKQISRYSTNLCSYKNSCTNSETLNNDSEDMTTTINPVFKYMTTWNRDYLPTTEFDPRKLNEIIRRCESPVITYTTQSLDRKRNNSKIDELILRPITQRQFDYLESNSDSINRTNTLTSHQLFNKRHFYYSDRHQNEIIDRYSSTHSIRDIAL